MVPGVSPLDQHAADRERLQADLLSAVKQCQTRFGGRSELATELDPHVVYLCTVLELVLSHGLKNKDPEKKNSTIRQVTDLVCGSSDTLTLWRAVRGILSHHERERYEVLRHVWTDRGRGRAWLRSALNEHSLERYLSALLQCEDLPLYYEEWAFISDQEANSILVNMAAGLGSILFAMNIDKPELNNAVHYGGLQAVKAEINEHVIPDPSPIPVKKIHDNRSNNSAGNIISFGDDDLDDLPTSHTSTNSSTASTAPTIGIQVKDSDTDNGIECAEEATNEICEIDLSNSDTEQILENGSALSTRFDGLRPVNNANIGELIPVPVTEETHSSEDSVSVPSFSEVN
ncbi:hypothetical protein AAG570_000631 [Ranatra chinensis]|uniref:RUN domain-containing protein n=1 Tax=Ranatra chinensis TaxID=642074 RepID=A0ABD0YXL0_9HEMI